MSTVAQPEEFDLPPELWEQIFQHLGGKRLLPLRLVCYRWKTILDQKRSLWTSLYIRIPSRITLDEKFQPENLPPAATCIELGGDVVSVSSWWPSVGERLTCLKLGSLEISSIETLLEMLGQTPNLAELALLCVTYASKEEPEVDFQLEKLTKLSLSSDSENEDKSLFECLIVTCPNIRELFLYLDDDDGEATVWMLDYVQDTLERLNLQATSYILEEMATMENLRLKSVVLSDPYPWNAVRLSEIQPSVEELDISESFIYSEKLCEIGTNLPKLKKLATRLDPDCSFVPTFLSTMPHLEALEIHGSRFDNELSLDFDGFQCPKLTELVLNNVDPTEDSLRSFLSGSGNLQKLHLTKCTLFSCSELFAILAEHSSLRRLSLWNLDFFEAEGNRTGPADQLYGLEFLSLSDSMPNEMIIQLCSQSPRLRELRLSSPTVDDGTVQSLCRLLPRLDRLELDYCALVTVACAELIKDQCSALKHVEISNCGPKAAAQKLAKERLRYLEMYH